MKRQQKKNMQGGGRAEQAGARSKEDIRPMVMRSIRQTFLFCCVDTAPTPAHSYAHAYAVAPTLLLNLSQNLSIFEKEVFLQKRKGPISTSNPLNETKIRRENQRTSSPTLIALPPQPGNKTLSPALTDV